MNAKTPKTEKKREEIAVAGRYELNARNVE